MTAIDYFQIYASSIQILNESYFATVDQHQIDARDITFQGLNLRWIAVMVVYPVPIQYGIRTSRVHF
jgi:hypothetical protein